MMLASGIVIANLLYPLGAVVAIVILSLVVTLRHRKPKSVEANVASFNKGLRALAPDAEPARRRPRRPDSPEAPPPPPRPSPPLPLARSVQTVTPKYGRVVRPEGLQGPAPHSGRTDPESAGGRPHHDREAETG